MSTEGFALGGFSLIPFTIFLDEYHQRARYEGDDVGDGCSVTRAALASLRTKLKKIEHAYWLQAGFINRSPAAICNPVTV